MGSKRDGRTEGRGREGEGEMEGEGGGGEGREGERGGEAGREGRRGREREGGTLSTNHLWMFFLEIKFEFT